MFFLASERWVHKLRSVTMTPAYRHKSHCFKFISAICRRKIYLFLHHIWARFDSPRFFWYRRSASREEGWGAGDRVYFCQVIPKKNQQQLEQQQTQSIVPSTNNETFPNWCMMLGFFSKSCQVARNITQEL